MTVFNLLANHRKRLRVSALLFVLLSAQSLVLADSPDHPRLSIADAAKLAEAELARRGLAKKHHIVSIWLMPARKDSRRYYSAHITPPIRFDASEDGSSIGQRYLEFHIQMSGRLPCRSRAALRL